MIAEAIHHRVPAMCWVVIAAQFQLRLDHAFVTWVTDSR
jgi:hypothetical protein